MEIWLEVTLSNCNAVLKHYVFEVRLLGTSGSSKKAYRKSSKSHATSKSCMFAVQNHATRHLELIIQVSMQYKNGVINGYELRNENVL